MFGIDLFKISRENTLFGFLYRNDNEELLQNIKIKNLLINRIRVSGEDGTLLNKDGVSPFNEKEDAEDVVVFSNEEQENQFVSVNNDNGSLKEINLFLQQDSKGIRYFTGTDKNINKLHFKFVGIAQ